MARQRSNRTSGSPLWDHLDTASVDLQGGEASRLLRRADYLITLIMQRLRRLGWVSKNQEDYRQDILLSLLPRFKNADEPGIEPINNHDAYIAQSSFNFLKRRQRAELEDPVTKSLDSDYVDEAAPADPRPGHAETLILGEVIKQAWQEYVALMTTEQLSLFLFDRNDILWQLICLNDPIGLDEIADGLKLSPPELEKIMIRLPCKSDRDLADLMGVKEQRIHKLRNRMRPLLKKVQMRCGYGGRNGTGDTLK